MNTEQVVLKQIQSNIKELSVSDQEAITELAEFFRMNIKTAGETVGPYAIALVGAEMAASVAGI